PSTLQRLARRMENRFVGTQAAAEYSGIPAGTLRAWRCQGVGPRFYKPRGRALYDIADLDEFIRSGIRVSSVRASKEERNVYLPTVCCLVHASLRPLTALYRLRYTQ